MLKRMHLLTIVKIFFLPIAIIVGQCAQSVNGFPSQAGHCRKGSLSGKFSGHGEEGSGSLSNTSLLVKFDSTPLLSGTTLSLNSNQEYKVSLEFDPLSKNISFFKGFLFRLSESSSKSSNESGANGENVHNTLSVGGDNKVQRKTIGCEDDISAVTHVNNNGKRKVEFNFNFENETNDETNLLLEVTVVISGAKNDWYYDAFNLQMS